ncbi:hypothetical protein SASPL_101205 [Salvia splendens]|uniref:GTD-binding domain-containing protein n=1 Tax=Salvia splendens TaxID=180675 RepID=A0A8X8YPN4_SALSN|nr:hypothetical protein SASPL_101205 [Salvia splendens]
MWIRGVGIEKIGENAAAERERAGQLLLRQRRKPWVCEKNSIQMGYNQHRRLCEARDVHDEEVIKSLEWVLWRRENELRYLSYFTSTTMYYY